MGLGDFITPHMRCPMKKGHYEANALISLEQFGKLPLDPSVKYQVRLMLYEMLPGQKKRMIACLDGNIRIMESSMRSRSG